MLVPTSVEELDKADIPFRHAAGKEAVVGKCARLPGVFTIELESTFGLLGKIGNFRCSGLHAEGHFVLGDAGLDFRVASGGKLELIEGSKVIELSPAVFPGDAWGIFQVEDGVATAA